MSIYAEIIDDRGERLSVLTGDACFGRWRKGNGLFFREERKYTLRLLKQNHWLSYLPEWYKRCLFEMFPEMEKNPYEIPLDMDNIRIMSYLSMMRWPSKIGMTSEEKYFENFPQKMEVFKKLDKRTSNLFLFESKKEGYEKLAFLFINSCPILFNFKSINGGSYQFSSGVSEYRPIHCLGVSTSDLNFWIYSCLVRERSFLYNGFHRKEEVGNPGTYFCNKGGYERGWSTNCLPFGQVGEAPEYLACSHPIFGLCMDGLPICVSDGGGFDGFLERLCKRLGA